MKIEAVDLFCGAGGLTAGLIKSGIEVKAGYDIQEDCRYAYEYNNKANFINKEIATVSAEEIKAWYSADAIKILAGCAPCQPFSSYRLNSPATESEKYPLLYHFSRLIDCILPDIVIMENVPNVSKYPVYQDFVNNLIAKGYKVREQAVDCTKYGIPQSRKRHVLIASTLKTIPLIPHTHEVPKTVAETIGHLPKLMAGESYMGDPLHCCAKLSEINLKRIRQSKQGGTWKDWSPELIAECHKKESGKSFPSVYGRMSWDKPSPTLTTQCYGFGNGRFGHPEQDRAISLREAALLQTFPVDYRFSKDKLHIKKIGTMIGNAVPVRLGEVIGLSILKELT